MQSLSSLRASSGSAGIGPFRECLPDSMQGNTGWSCQLRRYHRVFQDDGCALPRRPAANPLPCAAAIVMLPWAIANTSEVPLLGMQRLPFSVAFGLLAMLVATL